MKVLGITGGVGMGKSVTAAFLSERQVQVIDTDLLARSAVAPGQPALAQIAEVFGSALLDSNGCLRREELARLVFSNPDKRRQLETIVHPVVRQQWLAQLAQWKAEGVRLAAVVIPLLFETDAAQHFDKVLCVACSPSTQARRLTVRGWTEVHARQRIEAQWPIDRKMTLAHFVIWTESEPGIHAEQVDLILQVLGCVS